MILDQYQVIDRQTAEAGKLAYELRGPRGARYGLMRNANTPTMLFAVNLRTFAVVERLGWFSDASGELKAVRR